MKKLKRVDIKIENELQEKLNEIIDAVNELIENLSPDTRKKG